jgi:hypothetical protein
MKKLLFIIPLLFCSVVYSAPSISTISKNLTASSNNVSFVLSGSDFGTHADNSDGTYSSGINAMFRNFEENAIESFGCFVENNYDDEWAISSATPRTGSYHARRDYIDTLLAMLIFNQTGTLSTGTLYSSFYFRANTNVVTGKPFRWYFGDNSSRDNMYIGISGTSLTAFSEASPSGGDWSDVSIQAGNWYFIEIEAVRTGASSGTFKLYVNGTLKLSETDYFNNHVFDSDGHGVQLGSIDETDNGTWDFDDWYTDYTLSRVVLGNSDTFSNCSHREIQIPTAWAADSITFTCNQGTFTDTDNIYAFVVDSDGTASAGKLVSGASGGGDEADTTPPSIAGQNPSDNATNVAINSAIVFVASDGASGVDLNSLTLSNAVSVNNVNYASSVSASGTKDSVTCTLSNAVLGNFEPAETVTVGVNIKDLSENSVLTTWDFTTEDNTFRQNAQTLTLNGQTLELK